MLVLADYNNNYQESQILEPPDQSAKRKEHVQQIPDTITDSGGVKVEDASLFLLDSPAYTVDSLPAYDGIVEPLSSTPTSSSSLSTSSCLSCPSFGSNTLLFPDSLCDDNMSTVVNTSPNVIPYSASTTKELGMSCSLQTLIHSSRVAPQSEPSTFPPQQLHTQALQQSFCPKQASLARLANSDTILLDEPNLEQQLQACVRMLATSSDSFTCPRTPLNLEQSSRPKSAPTYIESPQKTAFIDSEQEQVQESMAIINQAKGQALLGQSFVTPDGFSNNGFVAQDNIGKSFLGGCPQPHHPLQSNFSVHQGPGHLSTMPRYHNSNLQDTYRCLPFHHAAKNDDFLLSPRLPIMYSEPKVDLTSLYTADELKDLSLAGVEILSVGQQSSTLQPIRPYTKEEKNKSIDRYRQKRHERNFNKKIKYACRKTLADSRPRIKGRFARTDDT